MPDLVGNLEDRFYHNMAQLLVIMLSINGKLMFWAFFFLVQKICFLKSLQVEKMCL